MNVIEFRLLVLLLNFKYISNEDIALGHLVCSNDDNLRRVLFYDYFHFTIASGIALIDSNRESSFLYHSRFISEVQVGKDPIHLLSNISKSEVQLLDEFIFFSWFVKDNSVGIDSISGFYPTIRGPFVRLPELNVFSNCCGEKQTTTWSKEELFQVDNFLSSFKEIKSSVVVSGTKSIEEELENQYIESPHNYFDYNETNRIERSLGFLRLVRNTSFVIRKISLFIPLLECLFSDKDKDKTHNVSHRTSCFLYTDPLKIQDTYFFLKDVYDIRSRYLHGEKIRVPFDDKKVLLSVSIEIDNLVRDVLSKVILSESENFLSPNDKKYLLNLTNNSTIRTKRQPGEKTSRYLK